MAGEQNALKFARLRVAREGRNAEAAAVVVVAIPVA